MQLKAIHETFLPDMLRNEFGEEIFKNIIMKLSVQKKQQKITLQKSVQVFRFARVIIFFDFPYLL